MTPEELDAHVRAAVERAVAPLLERLVRLEADALAVSVQPEEACRRFGFSRATFDRWDADPRTGLRYGPEPVVTRPNGPGGKVLVHVARMQAWLDRRGARAGRGRT